ncbi:MAG: PAS domain S-box protein, partial [Magnetospirillum sp.]
MSTRRRIGGSVLAEMGTVGRWRFGIRAKLVVAVGTVAGMILVAGILTWFSYSEIERLLAAVTRTNLPSVSNALKLSEATARLAAAAPALDGSQSQFQRQSNFVALQQQTERLLALIDKLADTATDTGRVEELRSMIAAFGDNVVDRNILVDKRLQLVERGRSLAEVITGLDLEIHRSTEGLATDQTLAVVVLASNYLREAVVAPDLEKVGELRSAYEEQVRRLPMLIDAAGDGPRAVRARELTRRVLTLGTGPENVFELRSLQMLTIVRLAAANDEGRDLVARTSSAVGRLVSSAEADAAENERRTEAAVSIGRYTLLVVAMLTFFGPLLFVWLYLSRSLVSRLTGLAESMHRIVGGDFQAPIVGTGNDEIADMAAELVVFRDAMAKVQESSRALMASEERLRRILDTSPLALAISRVSDNVIISVNPRWSELYLIPEAEAIGGKVSACYADPRNRGRLVELVRQRGFVPGFECRMKASNGHEFWAMLSAAQIEMDGEPAVIVSSTDITRHKEEEAALAAAKRMAEDASQAKSLFLATMSHEIRTPMNGVLTMAHLLEDMPLPAEQREMARVIRDSATSLLTIINDILDFSKIEAGKLELEVVEMSVVEMVEGVAELLTLRAQEKGIGLITDVDPSLPDRMLGDPIRLRQIITNLAGNAIKFTDKGYVRISVRAVDARQRPLRLLFSITDTGIGLDSEQQARLFEPFMQADVSISRRYGGTGLGLSICRRLVAIMDGDIGVASNVGDGSTFWFSVPLAVAVDEPESGPDLSGIAVLVLAEGPVAAECIRQYLGHLGA